MAVLVVATALRFGGIAHGLVRGSPEFDERQNFVDPVLRMWKTGSPDPTVYNGYPGFFNYLAFLPVGLGARFAGEPGGYVAARALVAALGVLNVALAYGASRRLGGPWAGLFAAGILAVAHIEVRSAHYVTADVVVGTATLALIGILAKDLDSGRPRTDIAAGVLAGVASAVKYTGLLLAPVVLVGLWVLRRPRASLVRAGVAAAVAFVVAAPYALRPSEQGMGLATGLQQYYAGTAGNRFMRGEGTGVGSVPAVLWSSLGAGGVGLALLAILLGPRRSRLLPAATVVVAEVLVTAPANLVYPRHAVPAVDAACVLAGAGLAAVWARAGASLSGRALVAIGGLLSVAMPAVSSVTLVRRYRRPAAVDRVAEWIEAEIREPSLILTSLRRLQIAPERFEVRTLESVGELPEGVLAQYDLVVVKEAEAAVLRGGEVRVRVDSGEDRPELDLVLFQPAPHPRVHPSSPARALASGDGRAASAWDGDAGTTLGLPPGPSELEARWDEAIDVVRVEVEVAGPADWPQALDLLSSPDGERWEELAVEPLRPNRPHRQRPPHGQTYVLTPPRALRALRVVRSQGGSWTVADVRVLTAAKEARR